MEGWCVKAYLNATQKTDYIRIQKELLKLKNDSSPSSVPTFSSSIEAESRRQLIILLQVTVLCLASSIILTLILKNRRKIAKLFKNLFALKFANN